jgi:hypothetical protein
MDPKKRWKWMHGVNHTKIVCELGAQTTHGVDDEVLVSEGVADVGEGVGEALEAAAVVVDGEVALLEAVEVLEGIDGALRRIVEEEAAYGVPGGVHSGTTQQHHVADGLGHSEVDPRDDAMVDLGPLGVEHTSLGVDGAVNMVHEAELAEGEFEE